MKVFIGSVQNAEAEAFNDKVAEGLVGLRANHTRRASTKSNQPDTRDPERPRERRCGSIWPPTCHLAAARRLRIFGARTSSLGTISSHPVLARSSSTTAETA
jgi:hypothetical protein